MTGAPNDLTLNTPRLRLHGSLVPWDTTAFGFPVASIHELAVADPVGASEDYSRVSAWLVEHQIRLASCRLSHDRLQESMFLERQAFRFIEMVLHPCFSDIQDMTLPPTGLAVSLAGQEDVGSLAGIAGTAFHHERFHVDPRLPVGLGGVRYARWVASAADSPTQELLKVTQEGTIVALFIVERRDDGSAYWHLTAVTPEFQGRGFGTRAWQTVLDLHRTQGVTAVRTTISARNSAVLNLYVKLGARFLPPAMTFHWYHNDA